MFKSVLMIVIGAIPLLGVAFLVSAQEKASSPGKKLDQPLVKYEAGRGKPKRQDGGEATRLCGVGSQPD